jgi:hypothetical protein
MPHNEQPFTNKRPMRSAEKERLQRLWRLQLQLQSFIKQEQNQLDPSLGDVLRGTSPPNWFGDDIVFSPLIISMLQRIKKLEAKVAQLQTECSTFWSKKLDDSDRPKQRQIIDLHEEIDHAKAELEDVLRTSLPAMTLDERQSFLFDTEFKEALELREDLIGENKQLEELIKEWLNEIEKGTSEYVAACSYLKRNTELIQNLRKKVREMKIAKKSFGRVKDYYDGRHSALSRIVEKMCEMKDSNDRTIQQLEEKYNRHQEMMESLKNISILIQKSGESQANIVSELIQAVVLSEKNSAQVQKHHFMRENYCEELKRLEKFEESAKSKFDEKVKEYKRAARHHYGQILAELARRTEQVTQENGNCRRQKDLLDSELTVPLIVGVPISSMMILDYKAQLSEIVEQKVTLVKEISRIRRVIPDIENQCKRIYLSTRDELIFLRERRQELEMSLAITRAVFSEIAGKNAVLQEDNKRIRGEIDSILTASQCHLRNGQNESKSQIRNLQLRFELESRENDIQIESLQKEVANLHILAEEKRLFAHRTRDHFRQEKRNEKKEIKKIGFELSLIMAAADENKEELVKGHLILHRSNDQVRLLKGKIREMMKKMKRQGRLIEKMTKEQVGIAVEIRMEKKKGEDLGRMLERVGKMMRGANLDENARDLENEMPRFDDI